MALLQRQQQQRTPAMTPAAAAAAAPQLAAAAVSARALRRPRRQRLVLLASRAASAAPGGQQKLLQQQLQQKQLPLWGRPATPSSRGVVVAAAAAAANSSGGGGALAGVGIVAAVLGLGTVNRVLYRLALVPLADYVFFLAQFQNVAYIVIYYALLVWRARAGLVTREMLATPKLMFVFTGACEAAAQLLMMTAAARLPGALLPLLMQTVLLWNLLFSRLAFGARPSALQVAGVAAVLAGVAVASSPAGAAGGSGAAAVSAVSAAAAAVEPLYLALALASFAFPAAATIAKERIFRAYAAQNPKSPPLDVLIVNAFCSTAQAGFLLLLLPVTCRLKGLPLSELPAYLAAGLTCLKGGAPPCGSDCGGALPLAAAYVAVNVGFNIAAMLLVRSCGAVTTSLAMAALVPLTILAFALPLPLLPPTRLGAGFAAGTLLILAGLLCFNARVLRAPLLALLARVGGGGGEGGGEGEGSSGARQRLADGPG